MEVKKAIEEAGEDIEKAKEILRKKGAAKAEKKQERETREGRVTSYIHTNGKIGVLLKLYCETDFVARTEEFQNLAYDIAMHIAASDPKYISPENIPEEVKETERRVYKEQFTEEGKPEDVVEKITEGKMQKFAEEVSLLEQPFVKNPDKKVQNVIEDVVAKLGENVQIGDFARYEI